MRLLIKLQSTENTPYEMQYHYHLQGFIYKMLRESRYDIHNKPGYKFFCFSNIFPFKDLRQNDLRNWIISSPDNDFISYLYEKLLQLYNKGIEVGQMNFKINTCSKLDVRIPNDTSFSLITGTPIIIRIRREKYEGIEEMKNKHYEYVYWRTEHPINLFITQLEDNLIKKYNQYFRCNIERHPIFIKFMPPKKQISTRIYMNEIKQAIVIGTTWEFIFEDACDMKLIQFALDTGLGELGSMGFGFMNLKSHHNGTGYN